MPKTKKEKIYIICIAVAAVAILCVLIIGLGNRRESREPLPLHTSEPIPTPRVVTKEVERLVEVEKSITSDIIQDGLNDMGVLLTEEYYFTEVVNFSSVKKFLKTNIELKFTETSFLVSYDGVITAGIDFAGITVQKDEDTRKITVLLPKAEIHNISLDLDSFQVYSEKSGIGNPPTASDFNSSLVELEEDAKEKALDRGLLDRADANARSLILGFVAGLVDLTEYSLVFQMK